MRLTLAGGPYDGVEIDHNDMNLYTHLHVAAGRKFVLMPSRDRWETVRQTGDRKKGGELVTYELIGTPIRAAHYDLNGKGLATAIRDQKDGHALPTVEPDWNTFLHLVFFRGVPETPADGWIVIADEKDRQWSYRQIPLPHHGQELDQCSVMICQTLEEFRTQLSDAMD